MTHQRTPVRIAAFALSAVVVTGSIAGLGSWQCEVRRRVRRRSRPAVTQTTQAAIAPLKVDVVGRRVAA